MKLTIQSDKMMSLALGLVMAYAATLIPTDALAGSGALGMGDVTPTGSGDTIGSLLCGVVEWFTGTVGQGIATLAIIVIGIGALMGKVSWGMAIIVGIGVAVIFGAPTIVNELSGHEGCKSV